MNALEEKEKTILQKLENGEEVTQQDLEEYFNLFIFKRNEIIFSVLNGDFANARAIANEIVMHSTKYMDRIEGKIKDVSQATVDMIKKLYSVPLSDMDMVAVLTMKDLILSVIEYDIKRSTQLAIFLIGYEFSNK